MQQSIVALREIKRIEPSVFTIMLTGYPYKAYRDQCMEGGADHFLHKSSEFDKVAVLIRQFQQRRRNEEPGSVSVTDNGEPTT